MSTAFHSPAHTHRRCSSKRPLLHAIPPISPSRALLYPYRSADQLYIAHQLLIPTPISNNDDDIGSPKPTYWRWHALRTHALPRAIIHQPMGRRDIELIYTSSLPHVARFNPSFLRYAFQAAGSPWKQYLFVTHICAHDRTTDIRQRTISSTGTTRHATAGPSKPTAKHV